MPNPYVWILNVDQGYKSTARSLIFPSPFFPKVFWYLFDKSNSRRVNQETIHYEHKECTGSSPWAKHSITHTKQYPFPILLQCNNHQGAWELVKAIIRLPVYLLSLLFLPQPAWLHTDRQSFLWFILSIMHILQQRFILLLQSLHDFCSFGGQKLLGY